MSASNWDICPRCKWRHEREAERLRAEANAAYGALLAYEWKKLDEKARKAADRFTETNFREDYEIGGAESGSIVVSYNAGCNVCGLSLKFEHEVLIEGVEE